MPDDVRGGPRTAERLTSRGERRASDYRKAGAAALPPAVES
jgi:hypothetical protein